MVPGSVEIDLRLARTTRELHRLLSSSLGFPSWYGNNWDAFDEAIAELVELPSEIRFLGWDDLRNRLPSDADMLQALLADLRTDHPNRAPMVQFND
jgi:ribonuclease inhibitor